jgi:starch-binding outer membrane protein, SusD/RagB family
MKNIVHKISLGMMAGLALTFQSCREDFLSENPRGALDENVLATEAGAEALLIGAYSVIDGTSENVTGWEGAGSNWVFGSIAGGEGNKGSDAGDQPPINAIQTYTADAANPFFDAKWRIVYDGVARSNSVLRILPRITNADPNNLNRIMAEARALRGHYHFEAKRMWNNVPYMDENTTDYYVPNDRDIWPEIEADLRFAYDNLPVQMNEIGRINKFVAGAMLAKALMYQQKFGDARPIIEDIIANGVKPNGVKFSLLPNFRDIFDAEYGNAAESVFAWQYSVNDGSQGWNGGWGEVLNFPYLAGASPGGCCGFFQPTQAFVNAFRTTPTGLPLWDGGYLNPANEIISDDGLGEDDPFTPDQGPLDPRLDWTVGRRGIPYLDWGIYSGRRWVRDQNYAGPYSPKKQVYRRDQEGTLTEVGNWTSGWTANNYQYIRFAEVLLWAAEIEIETGSLDAARTYINQVRARARDGAYVRMPNGNPAANYVIAEYPAGAAPFDSQENARAALRMERKLELGMEGHRFFDLVRWGEAKPYLDRFLAYERTKRPAMYSGASFDPHNVYYPLPLIQIDLMRGTLTQNPGY